MAVNTVIAPLRPSAGCYRGRVINSIRPPAQHMTNNTNTSWLRGAALERRSDWRTFSVLRSTYS